MDTWVWLTAYVVGFGLLQVLLYRYFRRSDPSPETTEGRVDRHGGHGSPGTDVQGVVPCDHCGTVNEAHRMVRYCRSCTESLR
ncbi:MULTISPECIES: DUF7577 domain-containing protein [Haloarcula]|uniref:DUF7577 domain-containing protein n=1 Tax=Haloarcula pellucida TaxID=1427151 RepID=A0A830GN66_9EURY|nr:MULTISPECIES: hypothetical protein [Halomicroarcula]MBX0349230.1 hypothetical protein [Halomicroarcula pellucida]MDS0279179.1 hypothetical protein [Halomicroarcula sp. S1AR25-4]GGN99610.1 hypothetical protein GCM10009030_31370 [Halomicroarcula pellucida]